MDSNVGEQLTRMEGKLDILVKRVDSVEKRASFWGSITGAVTAFLMSLFGFGR
jgi:hypothetical protein